jgi:hypothetical protein
LVLVATGRKTLGWLPPIPDHVSNLGRLFGGVDMAIAGKVYDHTGIWIGTATATGGVLDHTGVRIGTVDDKGVVYDQTGIRIGSVRAAA